jgi:hypothetical protein
MAAGLALVGGGAAYAATTPPYEPDPNSYGTLAFYDAGGNPVTSGSINDHPMAAFAVGSNAGRTGDNTTLLNMAQPNPNAITSLWNKDTLSSATTYPLASGPANIVSLSQSHPVSAGQATDLSVADFIAEFPNDPAHDSNTSYQNLYQLRLITANGANQNPQYQVADILVSGTTWTQVYPAVATATSTTLTSSANPTTTGTSVTLTATETPATPGSVQFKDGTTNLGTAVAVNGSGVATLNTSFSTTGAHDLSAVFTPTDSAGFAGSTGTFTETVNPPATATTTSLAVTQDGFAGDAVKLVATVAPSAAAGSVSFYDNGSSTAIPGTVTQNPAGTYTLDLPSGLAAGSHSVVAKFSPTDVTQFEASQSAPQQFVLQNHPVGACANTGSSCTAIGNVQVTVPVGTLVISTPYTTANPLDLGTMSLTNNAGMLTATGAFNGIQITDTRSGDLPYTVTAQSSQLSDGQGNPGSTIDAHNVGLTGIGTASTSGGFAGTVTYTDHSAANPPVAPGQSSTDGLATAQTIIQVDKGIGVLVVNANLTINAPVATEPGLFTGTITLTVG